MISRRVGQIAVAVCLGLNGLAHLSVAQQTLPASRTVGGASNRPKAVESPPAAIRPDPSASAANVSGDAGQSSAASAAAKMQCDSTMLVEILTLEDDVVVCSDDLIDLVAEPSSVRVGQVKEAIWQRLKWNPVKSNPPPELKLAVSSPDWSATEIAVPTGRWSPTNHFVHAVQAKELRAHRTSASVQVNRECKLSRITPTTAVATGIKLSWMPSETEPLSAGDLTIEWWDACTYWIVPLKNPKGFSVSASKEGLPILHAQTSVRQVGACGADLEITAVAECPDGVAP
jgi:hypothetical protein